MTEAGHQLAVKDFRDNVVTRVEFADSLRGIAALSVLIGHFCGVFWLSPDSVAALLNLQSFNLTAPEFIRPIQFSPSFNFGSFGVAVFFLISGFVIPFSLTKLSKPAFLIARIFRIYPVYIVSLGISVLVLILLSELGLAKPFTHSIANLLAQFFLIRGWFWIPSIDGVSWTLEIEIVFYVIAAMIYSSNWWGGKTIILYALAVPVLCMMGVNSLEHLSGGLRASTQYLCYALPFTVFMFTGTFFFLASHGKLTPAQLVVGVMTCFVSFSIALKVHPALNTLPTSSYLIALGVFSLFWLTRDTFQSNFLLDWLASISYPLYAIHAILGYALMYFLVSYHVPSVLVIFIVFMSVMTVAWVLHRTIELPTMMFGKSLGQQLFPKKTEK